MATKTTPKKQATKKVAKKNKSNKATKIAKKEVQIQTPNLSILSRFSESRKSKKIARQKRREANAKKEANERKAQAVAEEKAKAVAIQTKAVQQVEDAVNKKNKRRSHPFATLLALCIVAGLAGALVWQYRDTEVQTKNDEISSLQNQAQTFEAAQKASEAAKQAEEAKYKNITGADFSFRAPVQWQEKTTQYPLEESVFGDDNVTFRIIKSDARNSVTQYIPRVDYIWQISTTNNVLALSSQSLHCERFDTLSNDLDLTLREHNGFNVYCDTDSEKTIIAAMAQPDAYGDESSGYYFTIEVNDLQQVNLADLKVYLESFKTN